MFKYIVTNKENGPLSLYVQFEDWGHFRKKKSLTCEYGVMEANWVWSSNNWMSSGLFLAPSATSRINLKMYQDIL